MAYRRMLADDAVTIDQDSTENVDPTVQGTSNVTTSITPYTTVNGVCKATSPDALDSFKALQRQINRCLSVMGAPLIQVDGAIGAGTLAAIATIQNSPSAGAYSVSSSNLNAGLCSTVAAQAPVLTLRYSQLADYLGAQDSVSSPSPTSTPSYIDPVSGQPQTQGIVASASDIFGNMSTTEKVGVAAIAVAVGFFAFKKGKR